MEKKYDRRFWVWLIYLPATVLYMEMSLKLFCVGSATWRTIVFTTLFALAAGTLLTLISSAFGQKFRYWSILIILFVLFVYFATQTVYFKIFKTFVTISISSLAGDAITDYWREMLQAIWASLLKLIVLAVPFILWAIFGKRLSPDRFPGRVRIWILISFIVLQAAATAAVLSSTLGVMSAKYLYTDGYVADLCTSQFGSLTAIRLEARDMIFPELFSKAEQAIDYLTETDPTPAPTPNMSGQVSEPDVPETSPEPEPVEYGYNVLEIDFDSLIESEKNSTIADMHKYFSSVEPTKQNEYTGMFAGKNLIWIVAEAFSSWAVDEQLTPTLYKMANNGFVFSNFYCPLWYCSTTGGEYVTMTGLLTPGAAQMFARSASKYMPFGFGNLMSPLGYTCPAWHNGSPTYYSRNETHSNMGYDFKAIGSGLELDDPSPWPASDADMIRNTVDQYACCGKPFSVYYMTISGHMNYGFSYNAMCAKNKDAVEGLPYTNPARAYLACQIELDLAMQELLSALEEAGTADDTLIVISADHYPYGLEIADIESLNGGDIEENFELYRSTLIMYCAGMEENVYVDRYCSSLDVMPTLANLFGLEYDSRLVMGRDVFSDAEPLVIFGNKSYITDVGRYNAATDTFSPNDGAEVPEGYARDTLAQVMDMFKYSEAIINNDYYRIVLGQ